MSRSFAAVIERNVTTIGISIVALFLLTLLVFPMGYDQAVFLLGGQRAMDGAIPYRDFIDTKPPMLFYIYGIAASLFGPTLWSYRFVDVLYHAVGLWYFYRVLVREGFGGERVQLLSMLAIVLVATHYVSTGFWMTSQAESFGLIPFIAVLDLSLRIGRPAGSRGELRPLISGVLAGLMIWLLFLLKYSLIVVPLATIAAALLLHPRWRTVQFALAALISFVLGVALYFAWLASTGALENAQLSFAWLRAYAGIEPLLAYQVISDRYNKLFPARLLETYSPLFVLWLILGARKLWRVSGQSPAIASRGAAVTLEAASERPSLTLAKNVKARNAVSGIGSILGNTPLLLLLAASIAGGAFSILYERKLFHYHYTRILWALAPFAALGALGMAKAVRAAWSFGVAGMGRSLTRCTLLALTPVVLFYSIMPYVITQPVRWTRYAVTGGDGSLAASSPQFYYNEQIELGRRLQAKMTAEDGMFLWGNSLGLYHFAQKLPQTICFTNTPFITAWTPPQWRDTLLRQLSTNPPRFFVVELGDGRKYISGSDSDSFWHLRRWDALVGFVNAQYIRSDSTPHFLAFRRR